MLVKGSPKTIDLAFVVMVLLFIFVFSFFDLPIKDIASVPSAIEGITTVTGFLFAVDALLLTRFYSDKTAPIEKIRASFYAIILAGASFFIGTAYLALLSGSQVLALKIVLIVFNISYVVAIALAVHLMRSDLLSLLKIRR